MVSKNLLDYIILYLHFGYIPERRSLADILGNEWNNNSQSSNIEKQNLVLKGSEIFREVFQDLVNLSSENLCHVVPISGGLDSRAILGGLLENVDREKIRTITFGVPGTWDYEIGKKVAHYAGVPCETIDLANDQFTWDQAEFLDVARKTKNPNWLFDTYINYHIPKYFHEQAIFWSGFMGDPLSGSHLLESPSSTWNEALQRFVQRNQFTRSINLVPPGFNYAEYLPTSPFCQNEVLSYDEQIDFVIRQLCLIKNVVIFDDYKYVTPFLHPLWINFILNVPNEFRLNQYLYKEILLKLYPELFELPTKNNYNLPLNTPWYKELFRDNQIRFLSYIERYFPLAKYKFTKHLNYIDFDESIRNNKNFRSFIYHNLKKLIHRSLVNWIDIDKLWNDHSKRKGNYSDALTLLSSLEINLKADNFKKYTNT